MATAVTDNPAEHRYEIRSDGRLAGYLVYRDRPGPLVLLHTEIDERFEGQGLGSQLVAGVLDAARQQNRDVLPFCPFVNAYLHRHPGYVDLVPERRRANFGL